MVVPRIEAGCLGYCTKIHRSEGERQRKKPLCSVFREGAMFKVKVYNSAKDAVKESTAWFKLHFTQGEFEQIISEDDDCENSDSGGVKDVLRWIKASLMELDGWEGK